MSQEHPRKPIGRLWPLAATLLAGAVLALRASGDLPLQTGGLPPQGVLGSLLAALPIGATLSLPIVLWIANRARWRSILRPTKGKVGAALALSLLVPGSIFENGSPLMIGPLYLFIALTNPSAGIWGATLLYFAVALLGLYPLAAALIWGLKRKARPLALLGLPVGLYALLYLAGGRI